MIEHVKIIARARLSVPQTRSEGDAGQSVPMFLSRVQAGFPSPAEDFIEGTLDLNAHLVHHPAATFLLRVSGESMTGAGIFPDDILIVDRSITPANGHIVIAVVAGELTVKRFEKKCDRVRLLPENPAFKPIVPCEGDEVEIWGVVAHAIHSFGRSFEVK